MIYGQHGSPGAPGTWQREVWWALNRAARVGRPVGRNRWRIAPPFNYEGMRVTSGVPRKPYGRSVRRNAYLTHLPSVLLFAWHRGELAGHMVAWRCGARTAYFRFTDEPDSTLCPACLIEWPGRTRETTR